jgi:hypothetical protein
MKSLRAGHPVGSLLLFSMPKEPGNQVERFLLVDGLQRVTAIKHYLDRPLLYLADNGLSEIVVEKLVSILSSAGEDESPDPDAVLRAVGQWMRATGDLRAASGFSAHKLVGAVTQELSLSPDADTLEDMYDEVGPILDEIKEQVDISEVSLPVLVFSGEASELPDIFEKLNSAGTTLSKYEIYAATWVDQETIIANERIRDAVDLKYQDLIDAGYEIAGLDQEGYSLFEYLFGLGKVLADDFPLLFGAPSDSATPESIAFTLMTVAHQLEIPNMRNLPARVRADGSEAIDPGPFEGALFDAVKIVDEVLQPSLSLRLNEKGGATLVVHTHFQIASMICRVLAATHLPFTWEPRPGASEEVKTLRDNLRAHYLYDLILGTWRSAGDTRVFRRTWQRDEDDTLRPSLTYLQQLSREDLDDAFEVWFRDQLQRNQRSRGSVRGLDKIFLKFVYSDVVTVHDNAAKTFELEHLFPVSRLADLIHDEPEGWPISAISNLALFESKLNREKSKKTIEEYIEGLRDQTQKDARIAEMDRYLLCKISDVRIPQGAFGGDALTREDYEQFLRMRFDRMKQLALRAVGFE